MPTKVLDLEKALAEFEARPELQDAINKALGATLDITFATDEELAGVDTQQKSRLAYVVGLMKLLNFLREPAISASKKEAQAKLAFAYVRHAETSGFRGMGIGRTSSDEKLLEEIQALRAKLLALSTARAERMNVAQTT